MHLNHPQTVPLLPGPRKNRLLPNRSLVSKRLGTTALREVSLGLLLWLGSQSIIASLTASQILNPHLNCPWRIFIETVFSLNFLLLPKFSAWKTLMPSVKSSASSSLAASWHILSLFLSIAPTPHHPPIPTGPRSALQRGFPSSPNTWETQEFFSCQKLKSYSAVPQPP